MTWSWRLLSIDGDPVVPDAELLELGVESTFPNQAEAESWLGQVWQDLSDAGIGAVTLLEESREVYGPMKLTAEP